MNYPPPNLWKIVLLNPPPEPEPKLKQVAPNLRIPVEWTKERIAAFLKGWNGQVPS
jgi:hypothetical protein